MFNINSTHTDNATTIIDMFGDDKELTKAVRILSELGWDDELISTKSTSSKGQMQASFMVENSMIAEFEHDFNATRDELSTPH